MNTNTTIELQELEDKLKAIHNGYNSFVYIIALIAIIVCIMCIYIVSFSIKKEIHKAIQEENITAQIKEGIYGAFNQFEIYEPN